MPAPEPFTPIDPRLDACVAARDLPGTRRLLLELRSRFPLGKMQVMFPFLVFPSTTTRIARARTSSTYIGLDSNGTITLKF